MHLQVNAIYIVTCMLSYLYCSIVVVHVVKDCCNCVCVCLARVCCLCAYISVCVVVQNVIIGEDTGDKLKTQVIHVLYLSQIVKYCVVAVGAVLLLCGCVLLAVTIHRRRRRSHSVTISLSLR